MNSSLGQTLLGAQGAISCGSVENKISLQISGYSNASLLFRLDDLKTGIGLGILSFILVMDGSKIGFLLNRR